MRIASFNTENLFSRAKVLNFRNNSEGTAILKKIAELQDLLKEKTYTNKTAIFNKYMGLKDFIEITEDRGKLFKKSGSAVVGIKANGADEWDGSIVFKRDKFDEATRGNTAKVIKVTNADIFCIIEVENRDSLAAFSSNLLGTKKYQYNICIDGNDARGIDVGIYSRFEIKNIRTHIFDKKTTAPNSKPAFPRDCLEVEFKLTNTKSLHVVCSHLTSKLSDKTGEKRKLQAQKIKDILHANYDLKTDLVAVAGDFNDTPDSAALSPLLNMQNLFDVLQLQFGATTASRWTYHYQNKLNQIDYLLVSKPLKDVFQQAGIERRGIFDLAKITANAETSFPTITSPANAASDHGAVWADFSI
jgi:endonuclease/exonuclease/phosphatase family metal-dependent hydrolase